MPKTSYYVSLHTPDTFAEEEYVQQAGIMANVFYEIFADKTKLAELTKNATLTGAHTEIDVSTSADGLIGRAVVELSADAGVPMDKRKLSQMMKQSAPWSRVKIEKRAVPPEDLLVAEAA